MKLYNHLQFQLLFFLIFGGGCLYSQIPIGYYSFAEGLNGMKLKSALNTIIDDHIQFPYTSTDTDVWDILKETDRDTIDTNKVILLYTGWTVDATLEYNSGRGWTREHVWAKSRGDFGTSKGQGTDVHALRSCEVSINLARSNRWFGYGDIDYFDTSGLTGCKTSTTIWIWEPRDEDKGDVVRMIFYMATRYDGENGELDLMIIDTIPKDNNINAPIQSMLTILLQWHNEDPVNSWERRRNDVIYSYQKNRNPFIDRPEFANLIWGKGSVLKKEASKEKVQLIKIVDVLKQEIGAEKCVVKYYIFSDGRVERKIEK